MTKKQKLTEFEKKWGIVCPICNKRRGTLMANGKSEPGKTSVCECKK